MDKKVNEGDATSGKKENTESADNKKEEDAKE